MSTVIYTVTSRDTIFNGEHDFKGMSKDPFCWYKNDNRKESLEVARKYSDDDTIHVWRAGIMRNVYQWSALEIENDEVIGCEVKIFDPLNRFKRTKKIAKYAHLFSTHGYDLISYFVGKHKLIGKFMHGNHDCYLYRYEDTAFGDFTAYEDNRGLWLPENFCDYGILKPDELMLAMDEGVTFWQDWQTNDRDERLFYKIFQNY